jgi:hypothetical protein
MAALNSGLRGWYASNSPLSPCGGVMYVSVVSVTVKKVGAGGGHRRHQRDGSFGIPLRYYGYRRVADQ